ncbi:hypothetical protein K458DRAFT_460738 [Lentithecium fluviatile CBS 122367]|uniref:Uncharacterized protein n=1 Tax=Lentithecium fluviatile CBS 122367 TaxID=1168545 RepID=A0A6G1IMW0_9PLEO|nr:hypothetical protein K458DRAFT_460738 [Lentithecium fluviatile CBS 122367]
MPSLRSTLLRCAIAIVSSPAAFASLTRNAEEYSGVQYLGFNGTVSGSVTYANPTDTCESKTIEPLVNAYIYVGVNPEWDTNPFYFEIYHLTSDYEVSRFVTFTDDDIFNLEFASSAYACWGRSSEPCGALQYNPVWEPEIMLDLKKASLKRVDLEGGQGYEITGDEATYMKNETLRATVNGVDVVSSCYQDGHSSNSWRGWVWNETTSWSYTITFNNVTASGSIKTTQGDSTMELSLTGSRITNETFPNIELVTDDESKPQFRYSNDSEIHFRNASGTWIASPDEFADSTSSGTSSPTSTRSESLQTTGSMTGSATGSARTSASTGVAEVVGAPGGLVSLLLAVGGMFVF